MNKNFFSVTIFLIATILEFFFSVALMSLINNNKISEIVSQRLSMVVLVFPFLAILGVYAGIENLRKSEKAVMVNVFGIMGNMVLLLFNILGFGLSFFGY